MKMDDVSRRKVSKANWKDTGTGVPAKVGDVCRIVDSPSDVVDTVHRVVELVGLGGDVAGRAVREAEPGAGERRVHAENADHAALRSRRHTVDSEIPVAIATS